MLSKDQYNFLNKIYKLNKKRKNIQYQNNKELMKNTSNIHKRVLKTRNIENKYIYNQPIPISEFDKIAYNICSCTQIEDILINFKLNGIDMYINKEELKNNQCYCLSEQGKLEVEEYRRKIFINPIIQWIAIAISIVSLIIAIIK